MARYTGPRARVSRRLGTNIWGTNGENSRSRSGPTRLASTAARAAVATSRVPAPAPGEAEGPLHLRPHEKQFRNLYAEANRRQGVTGETCCASARAAPRQRGVPRRLGGHPSPGPPVRQPRPRRRQRQAGEHPQLPGSQGRRHPPARQGTQHGCRPMERGALRPHTAAVDGLRGWRPGNHGAGNAPSASRSTCPSRNHLIVELYSK